MQSIVYINIESKTYFFVVWIGSLTWTSDLPETRGTMAQQNLESKGLKEDVQTVVQRLGPKKYEKGSCQWWAS